MRLLTKASSAAAGVLPRLCGDLHVLLLVAAIHSAPGLVAQAPTNRDIAVHVLNRIGFGPTPALSSQLEAGPAAVTSYIASQLNPVNPHLDNAVVQALMAQLTSQPPPAGHLPAFQGDNTHIFLLQSAAEMRAAFADWQLNELMTRFWNDHFNRSFGVNRFQPVFFPNGDNYAVWFLLKDDEFYRNNALGQFGDLLEYTAGSVSMLLYLDNYLNKANGANQNWARELCELFTMGEANASTGTSNYDQQSVIDVARCFTGWTVTNIGGTPPQIVASFDPNGPNGHDATVKNLFVGTPHPLTVPAGGTAQVDGLLVLNHLAGLPATADFVVRKLMVQFFGAHVFTNPAYQTLLANAKAQWGPRGDIKAVLAVLLNSPQFVGAADRWQKIKSPLHSNVSLIRAVGAAPDWGGGPVIDTMTTTLFAVESMGQPVFSFETPDGYPMSNIEQLGVSGFADRVDSAERCAPEWSDPWFPLWFSGLLVDVFFDPAAAVLDPGIGLAAAGGNPSNPPEVAAYLARLYFGDKVLQPNDLFHIEQDLGPAPLPPTGSVAYRDRLRIACELIASFTHFSIH